MRSKKDIKQKLEYIPLNWTKKFDSFEVFFIFKDFLSIVL